MTTFGGISLSFVMGRRQVPIRTTRAHMAFVRCIFGSMAFSLGPCKFLSRSIDDVGVLEVHSDLLHSKRCAALRDLGLEQRTAVRERHRDEFESQRAALDVEYENRSFVPVVFDWWDPSDAEGSPDSRAVPMVQCP